MIPLKRSRSYDRSTEHRRKEAKLRKNSILEVPGDSRNGIILKYYHPF